MKAVLDSSAVLAGVQMDDGTCYYMAEEAAREVRSRDARLRLEMRIREGRLSIATPGVESRERVAEVVRELGEEGALSKADVSTISLAYEMKESGEEVVLLSDDHGVQNVAAYLSLPCMPVSEEGIRRMIRWRYLCSGCGREYERAVERCWLCGGKVRRRRDKRAFKP